MYIQTTNDADDLDQFSGSRLHTRNQPQQKKGRRILKQKGAQEIERTVNPFEETSYPFTYHASQHEKEWLLGSINEFYQQELIEDILKIARGGKEATVYLCAAPASNEGNPFLAVKVYRPRRFRNLKKDHLYREGREQLDATGKVILDDRSLHAMRKKTAYGMELLHSSWIGHEFHTMEILYEAGVDIPRPYASTDNAILMDFIGDEEGCAPTLNTVHLSTREARSLFDRVVHNIELMLSYNRVHADLSAYNILYWERDIKLIDFPQAIHPDENHNAFRIFSRDVERICDYFSTQGVNYYHRNLALQIWKSRGRRAEPEMDPLYLDPEKEEDRRAWHHQ